MNDVKLLSDPTNYAVVHLPGRAYSGVVFQGDSLHILIADLERARAEIDPHEREATVNDIIERLLAVQSRYEAVLKEAGMSLPYFRP
ncbi:DUF6959 family protein [Sphingomonas sp.]|uniref:DUF6959 family protein n=1 Tax=Sphingomonas sp. TaxID=28214 RepID=UPI002DB6A1E9|nr:hypothetical protein [Sphingomonas sp.]HEU4968956.1 hypothetical protein [Sphingomonas sp.]